MWCTSDEQLIERDSIMLCCHALDLLLNNQYISDNGIIANVLNTYFINVGSSLVLNIQSDINPLLYIQNIKSSLHIPEINTGGISTFISANYAA